MTTASNAAIERKDVIISGIHHLKSDRLDLMPVVRMIGIGDAFRGFSDLSVEDKIGGNSVDEFESILQDSGMPPTH
jgi:hypothetical protein